MARTKNYCMTRSTKTLLALMPFGNAETKSGFKSNMIDAEIFAESTERVVFNALVHDERPAAVAS